MLSHLLPCWRQVRTHHIRSGALHWHHMFHQKKCLAYFPLKKRRDEPVEKSKREGWQRCGHCPAGVKRPPLGKSTRRQGRHPVGSYASSVIWLLVASTVLVTSPRLTPTHFSPKLWLWRLPDLLSGKRLSWLSGGDCGAFAPSSSSPPSLHNRQSNNTGNDENKMTTESLHTVIQYKYKHYEKMRLFSSNFYTKCKGCFISQEFISPPFWYEVLIFMLDANRNCVIVFTTVPWYWRTLETFEDRTDAQH